MISSKELIAEWAQAQDFIATRPNFKEMLTTKGWWTEIAGVFILSPRQTGKTSALKEFIRYLKRTNGDDRVVTISPYKSMRDNLAGDADLDLVAQEGTSWLYAIDSNTDHLVVDEFMYLPGGVMDTLLSFEWRSVTMIGSMK